MKKCLKIIGLPLLILDILLMTSTFLCSCSPISQESVIEDLLPNLWVFLAHIFATIVLLIICIWLVWNPTKNSLKKRHEYIANQIKEAENNKKAALNLLSQAEKTKMQAFNEANEIIEHAKKTAYLQKKEIEQQALLSAKQIENNANLEAEKIKNKTKKEINDKVLDLTFTVSNALLKKKVTKKENDAFVDDFLKEIEKTSGKEKF